MGILDSLQGVLNSVFDLPNKAINSLGALGKKTHDEIRKMHPHKHANNVTEGPIHTGQDYIDPFALLGDTDNFLNDAPLFDAQDDEIINDVISEMIETMNGMNPPAPNADQVISAFEVPINQTGNILVEIVEDATGKTINLYQEENNITEKAKHVVASTTEKIFKRTSAAAATTTDYYSLTIIIIFVIVAILVVGSIFVVFWRKRNNNKEKNYCHNSGVYDVEEATKNNIFKQDHPKLCNVSLA